MSKTTILLDYNGVEIPIVLYIERRKGWRVSIRKEKAIVRLSNRSSKEQQRKGFETAKDWIKDTLRSKPELLDQFILKNYDGSSVGVMGETHRIKVIEEERSNGSIGFANTDVIIKLPIGQNSVAKNQMVKKLLSKLFASKYKKVIGSEVHGINKKYFKKEIATIKLKYNKSNWGSCSAKKNINLSSRLLLVPKEVREYVIIHELSHLIEMNHSKAFWEVVEKACPNYREQEKWLKLNGTDIDF